MLESFFFLKYMIVEDSLVVVENHANKFGDSFATVKLSKSFNLEEKGLYAVIIRRCMQPSPKRHLLLSTGLSPKPDLASQA